MRAGGFFCFVLVLAFFSAELSFMQSRHCEESALAEAKEFSFDLEKLSLSRSLMEASTDAIVEEGLGKGLLLNLGPEETKQLVNQKLEALFAKMEAEYGASFFPKVIDAKYLNSNSTVLLAVVGNKAVEAEYCYTGGLFKENLVLAEVKGEKAVLEFRLPAGYCVKETVVG